MMDAHSQMAEALADSMTVSVSAPGTYSTITNGGFAYSNTAITNNGVATGSLGPYTVSTGYSQPWFSNSASPKIRLDGEDADIEVNGESLMGLMKEIRERLNLITINEKMEKEWDELRALGDQYRALEAKLKEQGEMWNKLKAMPPPDIK